MRRVFISVPEQHLPRLCKRRAAVVAPLAPACLVGLGRPVRAPVRRRRRRLAGRGHLGHPQRLQFLRLFRFLRVMSRGRIEI